MERFSLLARSLHWMIAALLFIQVPLAWYMMDLPLSPAKFENYALHKSIGMVLFTLAVLRLIRAVLGKRPALPPDTKLWEKILAKAIQGLLYLIVIIMPISGWLLSSAANVPVVVFGLVELPMLVEPDKEFTEGMKRVHEMQSYILMTLVGLHIAAGLKHQFLKRDNVLYSMLPLVGKR